MRGRRVKAENRRRTGGPIVGLTPDLQAAVEGLRCHWAPRFHRGVGHAWIGLRVSRRGGT